MTKKSFVSNIEDLCLWVGEPSQRSIVQLLLGIFFPPADYFFSVLFPGHGLPLPFFASVVAVDASSLAALLERYKDTLWRQ